VTAPVRTGGLPVAADFAPPPDAVARRRWTEADREHRPDRLASLRERLATEGMDAYFGVKPEHMRWLTGFALAEGEDKVAGHSGQFLVGADLVVLLTDSRYTVQARREAPDCTIQEIGYDLPAAWPSLLASLGARRVAVEATAVPHSLWTALATAAPDVELVPAGSWLEEMRAVKTPDEVERIGAACAVADRALAALLPEIRPGAIEHDLALRLEWLMRTAGAEALAFDVACLAGAEAALPHGAPGDRPVRDREVLLFDFGAQVEGYRSDMTRTLFVGEPAERDLTVYDLVARAQAAAIRQLETAVAKGAMPDGRSLDATARGVIDEDGRWPAYGHGLGHGIGLATHELPRLGRQAPETPLPGPTVFSVEPGIYLEGETGVRIEDLVHADPGRRLLERLTHFPRDVVVLPG
jgi:Xaa-Pro aminopeptidase